jgi:hypothetical protein
MEPFSLADGVDGCGCWWMLGGKQRVAALEARA